MTMFSDAATSIPWEIDPAESHMIKAHVVGYGLLEIAVDPACDFPTPDADAVAQHIVDLHNAALAAKAGA